MERHTIMIHNLIYINKNIDNNNINNSNTLQQNVERPQQNVECLQQNVERPQQNVECPQQNVENQFDCTECYKSFSKNWLLLRHSKICKKIKNVLECEICHIISTSASALSYHRKKCKTKALIIIDNNNINTNNINNGTINTINTINNITNNNTINNNITVISFGDGKDIQFMNDHITAKMLTQMYSDGNTANGLRQYMQKLLEVPENRLIKKTNAKHAFSKVHYGNGTWETRLDQDIYPKLVNQMANDNWDKIRYYNDSIKLRESLTKRLLDNLEVLTSWDKPDDYEDDNKRTFKQTIGMLKLLVLDISKL
jgi:hypothetical protein